jgi:hypothetical protein
MKLLRMYNRFGWVEVSELDALETVGRLPNEWTLQPWQRPEGFPDVNIPSNWPGIAPRRSIDVARQIDSAPEIKNKWQADEVIRKYLAGTRHPKDMANV